MKIYWFYYKQIFLANLGLSFVISIIPLEMDINGMLVIAPVFSMESTLQEIHKLPFVFATFGFFIVIGAERFFYKRTNYLYHNLGFSKRQVIGVAFLINILVALLMLPLVWI